MRRCFSLFAIIFIYLLFPVLNVSALSYPSGVVGEDISWPNCNNLNFTPSEFGIVGVNGGLSFRPNNCLANEAVLYRQNLSLYVNTGFPGSPYDLKFANSPLNCSDTDINCLAYNYGYNAGKYAANYALVRGIVSNNWWLDVETVNSWSINTSYNVSSLKGELAGIKTAVNPSMVGFYSYPTQWSIITNNWQVNLPNWLATNSNYKNVAVDQCKTTSLTSGRTYLTQYIGKLDFDLAC